MVNEQGRKKIKNVEWRMTSFYISDDFKKAWGDIKKLAEIDKNNSEEFSKFCQVIKGIDIKARSQGIMTLYLHWILTNHLMDNSYKLKK